jgi:hypothetical protein
MADDTQSRNLEELLFVLCVLKCRALIAIKFNCVYVFARRIVKSLIWAGTDPSRFGCGDGICVVTRCRSD